MLSEEPFLDLEDVSKAFPGVHALRNVDFAVNAGEVVSLVGQNGAGKSTLMSIIGGICTPDSGTVSIGGGRGPDHESGRGRGARHRVRPSGAHAGAQHDRCRQHLPAPGAHEERAARLQGHAGRERWHRVEARIRDRSGPPRRRPHPGREGGRGDRQSHAAGSPHPHPRRGDRPTRLRRSRASLRARVGAQVARDGDHLHQSPFGRGGTHLGSHRRPERRHEGG